MADGKREQAQRVAPTGQTVEIVAGRIVAAGLAEDIAVLVEPEEAATAHLRKLRSHEELIGVRCAVKARQLEVHRRLGAAGYSSKRKEVAMLPRDAAVIQTFVVENMLE